MRVSRSVAIVAAVVAFGAFAQSAQAAKVGFVGGSTGSTKAFTGNKVGTHSFSAQGGGGVITVTCTGATFTGTATFGSSTIAATPSYSGCSYTQGGLSGAATVSCTGTFNINATNASVLSNNAVADTGTGGTVALSNNCDIVINANCTLRATTPTAQRFNADGRPADNGVSTSTTTGTFPAAPGTTNPAIRLYAKVNNITVAVPSGKNCSAFGFAASTNYTTGKYFGNTNVAATSSPAAPATSGAAGIQVNGLYATN